MSLVQKRLMASLGTAALVSAMLVGNAGAALAGEVNGKGEPIEIKANSECAFSGLQDEPFGPGNTQTWGNTKDTGFVLDAPRGASDVLTLFGQLGCNAHLHPLKGD